MKNKKQNLIKQFNLPKYIKGKSFADASKAIESKFEGLNDKAAKDTKQALMQRLADMQEYVKEQQAPSQEQYVNPMQTQMAMGGFDPTSMLIEKGIQTAQGLTTGAIDAFGKTNIDTSGNQQYQKEKVDFAGAGMNMLSGDPSAGMQLLGNIVGVGKANKDIIQANKNFEVGSAMKNINSFGMGGSTECGGPGQPPCKQRLTSAPKEIQGQVDQKALDHLNKESGVGFDMETARRLFYTPEYDDPKVPEINYGKYKDVGYFDASLTGNGLQVSPTSKNPQNARGFRQQMDYIKGLNKDIDFNDTQYTDFQNRKAMGGFQNDKDPRFLDLNVNQTNPEGIIRIEPTESIGNSFELRNGNMNIDNTKSSDSKLNKADLSGIADFGKSALRYAPALMNAFQLANMEKPEVETRQKMNSKYNPQLVDEERIQRSIAANQGNTSRSLQNVANGSKGFVAANMLGSDINTSKAIGQSAVAAQAQNNAQLQYGQQFDRQADQFNISQNNLEQDLTDRNKGVYDTNKSTLLSQIGNDLGAIGKEELFKQYPVMMGKNYKWNGEYFVNDKGDKKTKEEAAAIEAKGNQSSMGGYQSTFNDHMNMLMNPKKK